MAKPWHNPEFRRAYNRRWMQEHRAKANARPKAKLGPRVPFRKHPEIADRLPKKFPGCWRRPAWVRRYKATWVRLRKEDRKFRLYRAEKVADWRRRHPRKAKASVQKWRASNGSKLRRAAARYHRCWRRRRCDFCGRAASSRRPGMAGIRRIAWHGAERWACWRCR
ncbi:MAG TPA: hypothetical protein VNL38_01475 [Candidatus Nitrosotenuis sp.]|nr:hypothetical protein [Candidatus Nitrosotenuis sp.]